VALTDPSAGSGDSNDVDSCVVPNVSESQRADFLRRTGELVIDHRGRSWHQVKPGFFRPVHLLARLSASEVTRPTAACWGYQACLTEDDAHYANSGVPAYVTSDLQQFDEERLPQSRRYKLRKARRCARVVQLTTPAWLREQGHDVLRSSLARTGHVPLPRSRRYIARLDHVGDPAAGVTLAGLIEGRLAAYLTGHAVEGTAYVDDVVIASWALDTNVGTALTYEFMFACRRSGGIRELVHGLHAREDAGLCRYKEWLGLGVQLVPSRVSLLPPVGSLIRFLRPHSYYRLTGRC
jgi:hypothetical protein